MKDTDTLLESDEAVEAILGQAGPRLVPPDDESRRVREAVHAEWRAVSGKHRKRVRVTRMALAASVLLTAFLTLDTLRMNGVEEVNVASIGRTFGSIYVLGENSELLGGNHLTTVTAGQTLITEIASGIGLAWGDGGSLRVDENSRVEFVSRERIFLRSGRIYFDSSPVLGSQVSSASPRLTVITEFGEVQHVGTQYMAEADAVTLTISVREGEVRLETANRSASVNEGKQLRLSGRRAPAVVDIGSTGAAWAWIEKTTPAVNLDGRTVEEFLRWVSRETGLQLEYESTVAEDYAKQKTLWGSLDIGPREALEAWRLGTDLGWRIENGVIYVNEAR